MNLTDLAVLAIILGALVAVFLRVARKGTCGDCSSGGSCSGHCGSDHHASCPAVKGVDQIAEELSHGMHKH
ncbi:hypothetical protein KPC83_01305 [Collinsella sp. zg1085]|uniref:hypothetical protein n=1 Tax=Collinsella sp. zg1085 TaxID=2844380 RepID=UPI001C0AEE0F|nr:hypothetical protein [Collinsella sp. zg1085]QWT17824.1 hypothetical protein KPC83_01305 [Collinsella sp. zg1085]